MKGDFVSEGDDEVVSISGKTNDDHGTTKGQHPDGSVGVLTRRGSSGPNVVDGGEWTDGVGDVVGAVGERLGAGSHDLKERVHVFGFVRVLLR